jgi:peptide/nickel transport system permease protein
MGWDKPVHIQYLRWITHALQGDLGVSLRGKEPVTAMLARRAPLTIQLTVMSMCLAVVIGIPAGIIAAIRRNSWIDVLASGFATVGMATPFFWLGMLLIMLFSLKLRLLPPSGYVPFSEDPIKNIQLMIMPSMTIGLAMSALVMRQTRTAMLQVFSEDYIRTARAKGVNELRIIMKHALQNALIPVVTVVGLQTGLLVGGAVITESVFSLPGLGRMLIEGIFERDFNAVQGVIIIFVLAVLVVNLLTDLVYAMLDKRIRYD